MADPALVSTTRRAVDEAVLHRLAQRLALPGAAPWLHAEVARRMGERLGVIKLKPTQLLDWWAASGASAAVLGQAYPAARRKAVEIRVADSPRLPRAPGWWPRAPWAKAAVSVITAAEVADAQAQLVWANMMLHTVADPMPLLRHWHRALAVDGFLMFSTLGPGSLPQLRALYDTEGWGPPMAPLTDMHDIGDMLVEAGFADPVMDQELLTLTWPTARAALDELRQLGGNAHPARASGLRTPRWRQRLMDALTQTAGSEGRVGLVFEVIYGHAFKPLPRARMAPTTHVAVDDLRRMARSQRPSR